MTGRSDARNKGARSDSIANAAAAARHGGDDDLGSQVARREELGERRE
jgi:hypothetical protein